MTRVSLKEAYDNKDVIAQIYTIRDTAESAVDTSEQAVTVANGARQHVDGLVPQVEQAVVNANTASSSAQASAQTVAGYENRLATAEGDIDDLETDLNAVTLRVTTAEGQIVTIQGRVTALETADGQNVKINNINQYAVGLTGNQPNISGVKTFLQAFRLKNANEGRTNVPESQIQTQPSQIIGGDDQQIFFEQVITNTDGKRWFTINLYGTSGQRVQLRLIEIDANGNVTYPWS